MLLPMAVIAVTTRKALERECAACGKKAIFPPSRIRDTVLLLRLWHTDSIEVSRGKSGKRRTNKGEERSRSMFRTLEEHAERFYGKQPGLLMRMVRLKGLVITSVLVIGMLLGVVMSLD